MRILSLFCLGVLLASCSNRNENVFVGTFESETRENYGSGTPGEWRIEVVSPSIGKYVATLHHRGEFISKQDLVPCTEDEDRFRKRPSDRVEVLCSNGGNGFPHGFLYYSENGLDAPAVKAKYTKNSDLVQQEGLKPGDPSLFEIQHYDAKYYAHAQWAFYGFRKVESK